MGRIGQIFDPASSWAQSAANRRPPPLTIFVRESVEFSTDADYLDPFPYIGYYQSMRIFYYLLFLLG